MFLTSSPKPPQYPHKAFDKCAIYVHKGGSWIYPTPWPTSLRRSNEGETHKKHYFGSKDICKSKYFTDFYSRLLGQTFLNSLEKKKKRFKPQTRL